MKKDNDIELKSEEIKTILSTPPRKLVQYGTLSIAIIFILLLIGSIYFRYPETIRTDIIITSENPPIRLYAKSSGHIINILIKDNENVKKGDVIALIESSTNIDNIANIKNKLTLIQFNDSVIPVLFSSNLELGSLQKVYNDFLVNLEEYNDFYSVKRIDKKIDYTQSHLKEYNLYLKQLNKQLRIDSLINSVVKGDFERDQSLFFNNIISPSSYDGVKRQYLEKDRESESLKSYISYAVIERKRIQNELEELIIEKSQIQKKIKLQFINSMNELKAAIKNWELLYVVKSPINGTISYSNIWKEFEFINKGEELFSVINSSKGTSIGYATLASTGLGKVKKGQRVNIQLDGYSYMENGFLIGYIERISLMPTQKRYIVTIQIPQNFKTSYGKTIAFNGELSGTAEIVTDEKNLIMRLLYPLKYIYNRNIK